MLISIITVNYNNYEGLKTTMKSVFDQDYPEIEYVIIDGGSTDESSSLIESYADKLHYWRSEKDQGPYDAMNKAIDKVTGDYILFLNSGDYLYDEFVIKKFVNLKPKEDFLYGNVMLVGENFSVVKTMPKIKGVFRILTQSINHQVVLFSKRMFEHRERYDLSFPIAADWVFMVNAMLFKDITWRHVDLVISCFDTTGLSSDKTLRVKDRKRYLSTTFDENFLDLLKSHMDLNNELLSMKGKFKIKLLQKLQKLKASINSKK